MGNKDRQRSGTQTAADLARAARAIYNVIRAALAAGLKGAAVAAVKETLPFLVKLVIGIPAHPHAHLHGAAEHFLRI